ncbi:hypothetical protein [uncultured Tateyamaria sp.]|uniref:hypothetical protein n=1 Tax=uncultured Tateyamaria sp. TaxID=455651 RepID=UPI00262E35FA|nr:hypothetical protein [uncultured Tateyamaria sp.]
MRNIPLSAVALCATTAAALACPTASDLATGVRVSNAAGESETFTRLADGNTASRFRDPDGFESEAVLINGLFMVTAYDIQNGRPDLDTLIQYVYDPTAVPLPEPKANFTWSDTVVYVENNRGQREQHTYDFGARTTIRYGSCQYAMIPVTGRFGTAPSDQETYHYLSDLGLSYLVESGTGADKLSYAYTRIEAITD